MANYCTCNTNNCTNGTVAGDSTVSCPLAGILGDSVGGSGCGCGCGLTTKDLLILIAIVLLVLVLLWGNI